MNLHRCIMALFVLVPFLVPGEVFSQEIKRGIWNGQEVEYISGQLCLKVNEGVTRDEVVGLTSQYGSTVGVGPDKLGWVLVQVPLTVEEFSIRNALLGNSLVKSCEPNVIGYPLFNPDDEYFDAYQWPLHNQGDICEGEICCVIGEDINVRKAWDITLGSQDILVAVLDSGIPLDGTSFELNHPELDDDRINIGEDFIAVYLPLIETDTTVRDLRGHGTQVAGIIGAETDNSSGIAGVAGGCELLVHQVIAHNGEGSSMAFKDAVIDAVDAGVNIVHFSAYFPTDLDAVEEAIDYADDHGVLVVAGGADNNGNMGWPAEYAGDYSNVISVGPLTCLGCFPEQNAYPSENLSVTTPGGGEDYECGIFTGRIIATHPTYLTGDPELDDGYIFPFRPASIAAAHTSGIAGLMMSANPNLTAHEVRNILEQSAVDKGDEGFDILYGWGRSNAYQAVLLSLAHGAQSHSGNATMNNGQRKLLLESDGTIHQAFESGGEIYYRNSTTGGTSWQETIRISSGMENNVAVCLAERSGKVYAVWQRPTDEEETPPAWDVLYNYSSDGGKTWLDEPTTLVSEIEYPATGPQPVILATSPSDAFGVMLVFRGGDGLYESHISSEPPFSWSTPASISGTDSDSKGPALAYRVSGSNPYKLVWDDVVSGNNKIYISSWNGSSWGGLTQVNSGSLSGEKNSTISITASNAVDIAWQGLHNGYEAIIHNRNLSSVYTIFENSVLGYSNPTVTGHANGVMTLIWQVSNGDIYKVKYNGTSWTSVSSIGSNGSNPSTSILNPAGGDARVLWTQGGSSPFNIYLASQTLNRVTADSTYDVCREIVFRDTLTDSFFSIEVGDATMNMADGVKVTGFVPVYDSLAYTPEDLLALLETEPFEIPSGVETISVTRFALGRSLDRFVNQATVRFELQDAITGEVLSSFGSRQLNGLDTLNVRDSASLLVRGLPTTSLKIRTVIEGVDLTDLGMKVSLHNVLKPKDVEQELDKYVPTQPASFVLSQNYPNPFNPTTTIKYELPSDSYVSLKVYDVLGREVVNLVDRVEKAGEHQVVLNASNLSSGIYFYRLKADDFTGTKRLVLLK